jgi:excisionase family DNA binding protein
MDNPLIPGGTLATNTTQLFDSKNRKEWLTAQEAAEFLGITVNALRIRVCRGLIPAYKLGPRMLRFKLRDLRGAFKFIGG